MTAIPDYSGTERSEVPETFKWRIADIFPSETAWRAGFEEARALAATLDALAGNWTASPEAMGDFMERLEQVNRLGSRLAHFASLQGDMDLGDNRYQAMKGEVQSFMVGLGAKLAFMDPAILELGEARVESYIQADPRLAPHRVGFLKVLRMKAHILPEGEARVVATAGLFAHAPSSAAGMLTDLDLPRPEVTLSTGEQVLLSTANYQKHRAAQVPADRQLVMETYSTPASSRTCSTPRCTTTPPAWKRPSIRTPSNRRCTATWWPPCAPTWRRCTGSCACARRCSACRNCATRTCTPRP
jgi:oligoendopeptidase F